MTKSLEKTLWAAAALAALSGGLNAALAARTQLLHLDALAVAAGWSLVLGFACAVRARLVRLTREEEQDRARAATTSTTGALFSAGDAEPFSSARTLAHLDRFAWPALALALSVALGTAAYALWTADTANAEPPANPLLAASFLFGEAFALFLFSRYLIGLARTPGADSARAPGLALGVFALAAAAGALSALAAHLGWPVADRWLARALPVAWALLAAEQFFLFLVSLYAPARRRGAPPIESRLAAWLTDPAEWTRDVAASLDYQFGVQAGHGALLRLLRRALLPLLAVQALLMYALSSLVFLGPGEEAIRERWGRPLAQDWQLTSGFHLKAPWPFETVRRLPARRILNVQVGYAADDGAHRPDVLLWTVPHFREEDVFVSATRGPSKGGAASEATSVSLVSVNLPVEYRITNLLDYAYRHSEPDALVRDLAYRALTREIAARDLLDLLGPDRLAVSGAVKAALQREADARGLGIEILFVGLQGVHPPVTVAESFQSVIGALEQKEAMILGARAYAASAKPLSEAEAARRVWAAEADRVRVRERAAADAQLFTRLRDAQQAAPEVLRQDLKLAALADALADRAFTVIAHRDAKQTLYFDLKAKDLPELYELAPMPMGDTHP